MRPAVNSRRDKARRREPARTWPRQSRAARTYVAADDDLDRPSVHAEGSPATQVAHTRAKSRQLRLELRLGVLGRGHTAMRGFRHGFRPGLGDRVGLLVAQGQGRRERLLRRQDRALADMRRRVPLEPVNQSASRAAASALRLHEMHASANRAPARFVPLHTCVPNDTEARAPFDECTCRTRRTAIPQQREGVSSAEIRCSTEARRIRLVSPRCTQRLRETADCRIVHDFTWRCRRTDCAYQRGCAAPTRSRHALTTSLPAFDTCTRRYRVRVPSLSVSNATRDSGPALSLSRPVVVHSDATHTPRRWSLVGRRVAADSAPRSLCNLVCVV